MDTPYSPSSLSGGLATIEDILAKLKFIAAIQPHEKIDVQHLQIQRPSWIVSAQRTYFGESRDGTLEFLKSTINQAFDIAFSYRTSSKSFDRNLCTCVITDLFQAQRGIVNIIATYQSDRMYACKLKALSATVEAKIREVMAELPEEVRETLTKESENHLAEVPEEDRSWHKRLFS